MGKDTAPDFGQSDAPLDLVGIGGQLDRLGGRWRGNGEKLLDTAIERAGQVQCDSDIGEEALALDGVDGLARDARAVGEGLLGEAVRQAQLSNAVLSGLGGAASHNRDKCNG